MIDPKTEAQALLPVGLPNESRAESSPSRQHQVYCMDRAKWMFGSYRRDDANDPDTYVLAIAAVLTDYPRAIVEYATDPRVGLGSKHKFPPNVAEVLDFCDAEMARVRRMADPPITKRERVYVPPSREQGCWAKVFVGEDVPRYADVAAWARAEGRDPREFRFDVVRGQAGVWVYHDAIVGMKRASTWRSPSDAELRARYSRQEAEARMP